MDGRGQDHTVNVVTGDVHGALVQAGSVSGGVHVHMPAHRSASPRSRAAERPSWLARLSDGTAGVLLGPRRILALGSPSSAEILADLPFGGVHGRSATVALRGSTATVLELAEPVDVIGAPLAAPALGEGHEFVLVIGIQNDIAVIETEIQGVVPELGTPSEP